MMPYRIPSFWTVARKPCGKDGKQNDDTEWRIYYPNDVLPLSSPRVQILHIRSGWRFMVFFITAASLRHRSGWYLTVRRQKELLAHVVRLRILACRNDLNRKRIVSLQLTAHSSQLIAFIFLPLSTHHGNRSFIFVQDDVLPSVITQNGGQKKNLHSILLRRSPKPVSSVRLRRPPPYK